MPVESKPETAIEVTPVRDAQPTLNESARSSGPRNGVFQQAISQTLPSSSNASQKRSASARSPSPSHPNKARRTDLPTAPRAMQRDGTNANNQNANSRSLLDRVGGPHNRQQKNHQRDEIQARIDNIVGNAPQVPPEMMMPPGYPMMGMDMNPMGPNMANPLMLQEMMMNQMALMAHMASSMGMINPGTGQFAGPGFPMQQTPNPAESGGFSNGVNNGGPQTNGSHRGRGGARGGRGGSRGRGGSNAVQSQTKPANVSEVPPAAPTTPIVAPTPVNAAVAPKPNPPAVQPAFAVPERPQSPTLCKFNLKCTNAHCRYSHPSPVATPESGVVLSNDPCEKGKDCKDKDCIKAHVSPAVLRPPSTQLSFFFFPVLLLIYIFQRSNQYPMQPRQLTIPPSLVVLALLARDPIARSIILVLLSLSRSFRSLAALAQLVRVRNALINTLQTVFCPLLSIGACLPQGPSSMFPTQKRDQWDRAITRA